MLLAGGEGPWALATPVEAISVEVGGYIFLKKSLEIIYH